MLQKFDENDFPKLFSYFSPLNDMQLFIHRYNNEVVPDLNEIETRYKSEYPDLNFSTELFTITRKNKAEGLIVTLDKEYLLKVTEIENKELEEEIEVTLNKIRNFNYRLINFPL